MASADDCVPADNADLPSVVVNELLCFAQQKSKLLAFDDILAICVDFYTLEEIKSATSIVFKCCKQRPPAYKGTDKEKARKFASDVLKVVLDPLVKLATFAAIDLSRLPSVGVDHMDITAFLREISMLRSEVRSVAELRAEIVDLRQSLNSTKAPGHVADYLSSFPPLQSTSDTVIAANQAAENNVSANTTTVADVARAAVQSGALRQQRPKRKAVVGSKVNEKFKPVTTRRRVEVFISRLHPDTTAADVEQCTTGLHV